MSKYKYKYEVVCPQDELVDEAFERLKAEGWSEKLFLERALYKYFKPLRDKQGRGVWEENARNLMSRLVTRVVDEFEREDEDDEGVEVLHGDD